MGQLEEDWLGIGGLLFLAKQMQKEKTREDILAPRPR